MAFLKKLFKGILGIDDSAEKAAREAAKRAEDELRRTQEVQKLQAQNEMQGVTQIAEDSVLLGSTDDNRKRRRTTGAATSNLGLNV